MLLFRMGCRFLFIRSKNFKEITGFLKEELGGESVDFHTGLKKSTEYSSLCFMTGIDHEKTYVEDAKEIILINSGSSAILSSIINNRVSRLISRVDMGPASIIMRVPGKEKILVDKLMTVFDGRKVELKEGIGIGEKDDTIISFTSKPISGIVTDMLDSNVLIHQPIRMVQDRLQLEALNLITQSLTDSNWYELRINIYDSYGDYEKHYERLIFILSKLELGMVLGESWTKDYAVMLYFVLTYQVRLFTFLKPEEIKKVLMALEYTIDGKRLVDFDLYYKNKKVNWTNISEIKRGRDKLSYVKAYRLDLYDKLREEDIKTLERMDAALVRP